MPLLGNIALGKYVAGDSPLHRLDPRTKLVTVTVMMTVALASQGLAPVCAFGLFVLCAAGLSRLPPALLARNLRSFLWLLLITALLHAFNTPGELAWRVPWLDLQTTREGLESAALFTLRLAAVVTAAALLTLTTSPLELTDGLERLLRPLRRLRVPSHELAMMISIALRFIPVLAEEAERLQKAQMARGAEFSGNPVRRARKLVPLLLPLFVSAFARADRLAVAMEARGYRGEGRTSYRQLRLGRIDAAAALLSAGVAAGILWVGRL
ncbi:MAG: energy-coupling factor transporter transmembrane protein EcfT [Gemmatimonadaceae bacterium]|nr:energy-coupling factor transporter transmembrane protein EcfT [Gemmatimonadaceae bacterium]